MGVLKGCTPRKEVLEGELDDAIFAADFGNLVAGEAPRVYKDPKTFFLSTHPAQALRHVVKAVFARLADPKDSGTVLRLSTGFGGGKTHALMALWHLANHIGDPAMGTDLLPAAGRPRKVTVVAIDAGKAGVPEFTSHAKTVVRSLHGEFFYQLGGKEALTALGAADDAEASPSDAQIEKVLPKDSVLILLDELVVYLAKLSERGRGNLLGFLSSLAGAVTKRPQAVLVLTDTAGQVAYGSQSAELREAIAHVEPLLGDVLGRQAVDIDPVGTEGARIIVKRLFVKVDEDAAQAASAMYYQLYTRVHADQPALVPPAALTRDYAQRMVECYPFHPRLLETAEGRLGALQDFQKSRGVLRLFARIVRDVWDRKEDCTLISAGDINWSSPYVQGDLLSRLNKEPFKAAISADVEGHAKELDGGAGRGVHRRVASALLLESLPLQANSGLEPADLTLAVLRPEEAGTEPSEALDRLAGACWHTYPTTGGKAWQFRYEPNIIKQIEERMANVPPEDARSRVETEVQSYFNGPTFRLAPWPRTARDVKELPTLQLALCRDSKLALSACTCADDSDPQACQPRRFRNAILAVTATPDRLKEAEEAAKRLRAAEEVEREYKGSDDAAKLTREQLKRIKPELHKRFHLRVCRAFDQVAFADGSVRALEEKYQVSEEQMLTKAYGQQCLRNFLEDKGFIYGGADALDVHRFMQDVWTGATPLLDNPEVRTAKALNERFLSAPKLRLVPDGGVVRRSILKAVAEGELVARLFDGRAYDAKGCVEGPEGARRRVSGTLTTLTLDDSVLTAQAGSSTAAGWTKESKTEGRTETGRPPRPPAPSEPSTVQATSWEKAIEYAQVRPLTALSLRATTPASAGSLAALAQPLGAQGLSLSLTVGGQLKTGGSANFSVGGVGLTHPIKPLEVARTLYAALSEKPLYEAVLTLEFEPEGRVGLAGTLQTLSEVAPDGVTPVATFGKPEGGSA